MDLDEIRHIKGPDIYESVTYVASWLNLKGLSDLGGDLHSTERQSSLVLGLYEQGITLPKESK